MPKFFIDKSQIEDNIIKITGEDSHHISRSLRMAVGEKITVTDNEAMEYDCTLKVFGEGYVLAKIDDKHFSASEPPIKVHLYQALPKGEKLDFIIQKSVECGVYDITPFESERCIAKVKGDSEDRKTDRRNKIALEAAKQCGRGIIPKVNPTISFESMMQKSMSSDAVLFCYEGEGTLSLGKVLKELRSSREINDLSIIIGSEGGFSLSEVNAMKEKGALMIGLGKRILRAETAAIMALSCLIYEFELN
jgi:16S rRNA (uracil1498-N3)-methyltransferase